MEYEVSPLNCLKTIQQIDYNMVKIIKLSPSSYKLWHTTRVNLESSIGHTIY